MRELIEKCLVSPELHGELVLPFDTRQKSRCRATTASGEVVGIFMERGTVLKEGEILRCRDGYCYLVRAEKEPVSVVTATSSGQLVRAAYHLGNRHVRLQVQ